MVTTTHRCTGD